jgi:mono/diheme cytochrome c family protein
MNPVLISYRNVLLAAVLATAAASAAHAQAANDLDDRPLTGKAARGRYIVTTSGCNDCHTPMKMGERGPELDLSRMLSGHPQDLVMPPAPKLPEGPWLAAVAATNTAWSGPWGVSFTANLTPDRETGLGKWSLKNFKETIRSGRHLGRGREILPPMPIPMYKHFTDEDLEAVYAYLQSLPPVRNKVPAPLPPAAATASN